MPTPFRSIFKEGKSPMNLKKWMPMMLTVAVLPVVVAGCAAFGPTPLKTPPYSELVKTMPASPTREEGSLWPAKDLFGVCADLRARNVGDIVTINIVESASASKNATTKTAKTTALDASWTGVLQNISGDLLGSSVKAGFGNSFDGQGATTRNSTLNAYISAQVIQVLPSGNLAIQGSRQVQVNNENQIINIQGVIRPVDIDSTNQVLSTAIAEAKIELNGQGVVSDKQRVGWLTKILDWVWPF
jgi:flagellar L-ring protein precursor FlgH